MSSRTWSYASAASPSTLLKVMMNALVTALNLRGCGASQRTFAPLPPRRKVRSRAMWRGLAPALAALTFATAPAEARTVRVFAVGPRFDFGWVDSREHFHGKLDGMLAPLQRLGRD